MGTRCSARRSPSRSPTPRSDDPCSGSSPPNSSHTSKNKGGVCGDTGPRWPNFRRNNSEGFLKNWSNFKENSGLFIEKHDKISPWSRGIKSVKCRIIIFFSWKLSVVLQRSLSPKIIVGPCNYWVRRAASYFIITYGIMWKLHLLVDLSHFYSVLLCLACCG